MATRFEHTKFDAAQQAAQSKFKDACVALERLIDVELPPSRAASLALTKLEEAYMWIGKAIRDCVEE
jgi:hypothetical protein